MEGSIDRSIDNGIARIRFYHPQSNSFPAELLRNLASEISEVSSLLEVKVMVLESEGEKAFCAGASFDELMSIKSSSEGLVFFSGFAQVINAMRKSEKLIIGRVQGKAVGGGVGLASSCDYCFATSQASVKLSELSVGIGPFVVGPAVQRKLGLSAMSELAIDASEWRTAEWAMQRGLYNAVFESVSEMDSAIDKLATTLSQSSPEAMKELKRIFWEGTENWDQLLLDRAAVSGRLVLSEFTKNAIEKFKKK
ncbi:MAG: enoyl-CoA hydratase/isomerase family protein [Flavobacteriales bacterium]|nr:enoyl-CoA hydratase/isomerase family protein [Flavobacteriales bacterium]